MTTSGEKDGRRWGHPMTARGEKPMAIDTGSAHLAEDWWSALARGVGGGVPAIGCGACRGGRGRGDAAEGADGVGKRAAAGRRMGSNPIEPGASDSQADGEARAGGAAAVAADGGDDAGPAAGRGAHPGRDARVRACIRGAAAERGPCAAVGERARADPAGRAGAWRGRNREGDEDRQARSVRLLVPLREDHEAWRREASDTHRACLSEGAWWWLTEEDWRIWRRRRVFDPTAAAARITGAPYDLRHSAASLWLHEGRTIVEVATWMATAGRWRSPPTSMS